MSTTMKRRSKKSRKPSKHRHHIVPRHAGGTDDPTNIILLTVEEHAEAHHILWKQNSKLQDKVAWLMLSGKTTEGELARRELARDYMKNRVVSQATREKMSKAKKGQPNGCLGTKRSKTSKKLMSEKCKANWDKPEYRQHMSDIHKGHKRSPEALQKQSESLRKTWAKRKVLSVE